MSPLFFVFANANWTLTSALLYTTQSIGHFGLYLLLVSALLGALTWPLRHHVRVLMALLIVVSVLMQFLLISDLMIFRLFRYHLNGLVWWVVKSEEGRKTLGIDASAVAMVGVILVVLSFAQYVPFKRFSGGWRPSFWQKFVRVVIVLILAFACVDKTLYAAMDLRNRTAEVSTAARALPWYWRITVKRWYARTFGLEALAGLGSSPSQVVSRQHASFSPERLEIAEGALKPDILLIVLDSWRWDQLEPNVMPLTSALAQRFSRFNQHYSGGNGTRDGMFALLSGTHSMRWFDVLNSPEPAPMITFAKQQGYKMRLRSATSLEFPEFRRTVFYGMKDTEFFDRPDALSQHERDMQITDDFLAGYEQDDFAQPRFDLLFYDSAHGPYSYPPSFKHFEPAAEGYYAPEMFVPTAIEPFYNRYRNACRFLDSEIEKILNSVIAAGRWENTVIAITGDHGEEFYEYGFRGHTSAFTEAQIHVPLLVHIPGRPPKVHDHRTQHVDVMPTILQNLGVMNSVQTISQGADLFDPKPRDVITCGWDRCSVFDGKLRLIFGAAEYNMTDIEVLDKNYQPVSNSPETSRLVISAMQALTNGR